MQLFGDLTVEDLVAEEPEPIRLARALMLSSSARAGLPHVDAERVSDLAVAIAEQLLAGQATTSRCRLGGLLHDIGTVAVSDRISASWGRRRTAIASSTRHIRAPEPASCAASPG